MVANCPYKTGFVPQSSYFIFYYCIFALARKMSRDQFHEIMSDDFFEAVIVGGGTCGLAVAARLCEDTPGSIFTEDEHQRFHWLRRRSSTVGIISKTSGKVSTFTLTSRLRPDQMLVLDGTSDSFIGQWRNQFQTCQIPVLRSPMFFHPDPANIDGMITYAHEKNRENDLMEIKNVVGKEYSKHQHKRQMKKNILKAATPLSGESLNHDRPGIIDINMRDYRDFYRPSSKLFEDFCDEIVERYGLKPRIRKDEVISIQWRDIHIQDTDEYHKGFIIKTQGGRIYGGKTCIVSSGHRGKINYPIMGLSNCNATLDQACHTSHIFTRKAPYPPTCIQNKIDAKKPSSLVIVGGGLTSAQLAHVACTLSVDVTMILRGPVKIKHFDFHLDWVTKYKNVKKSSFYLLDTDEERADLIRDARGGGLINPEYHKLVKKHVASGKLRLMCYTQIESGVFEDGQWNLMLSTEDPKSAANKEMISCDYVCCATGILADIKGLDFLKPMFDEYPINVVAGFPCLTDQLQWNETIPLYMTGKNAALKIGPTSANLDGARLGAERVGWKIQNDRADQEKKFERDARLELAGGNMNWYSLLQEVQC